MEDPTKKLINANERLKAAREQRCWTQARLAEEVGTTPGTVGRWERGESIPFPHYREKLCQVFGKSPEELGLLSSGAEPRDLQEISPEPSLEREQPVVALAQEEAGPSQSL